MTLFVGFWQFTGFEDFVHLLGTMNGGISAQLQISVAYFCSIGLYFLV